MPSNLLTTDTGFPQFREGQTTDQKFEMVLSYLFMLKEQLQYTLGNLGTENFNDTELEELGDSINEPIISRLEDDEENVSILAQTASQIYSRVTDAEGNISNLTQTAMGLSGRVSDAEGNISVLTQTANGLISRVADVEGNVSTLTQTVNGFEFVSYSDLSTAGKTTINGANITTGTLNASNINLKNAFTVYNSSGVAGGYLGYMSGLTGGNVVTDGIAVSNIAKDCYVIATTAGVRMQAERANIYVADETIALNGCVRAPEFIQCGRVDITPNAANEVMWVQINFTTAFPGQPMIFVCPETNGKDTTVIGASACDVSAECFTLALTQTTTEAMTVVWMAIYQP